MESSSIQCLLSLPPGSAGFYSSHPLASHPGLFCACDPPGIKLGSAGGSIQMLIEAWRATAPDASFPEWLRASRKLIVLGGGQSRRLPAYSAAGKPFIPIPVLHGSHGQRLDQTLIDLQLEAYHGVLQRAPEGSRVMVTSGDVLLRFGSKLPPCPEVDVLMLGMQVDAETATHFGVFFTNRVSRGGDLEFFLQKPSKQAIRELAAGYNFLVDTGMWLLSERAIAVLLKRCGWDPARSDWTQGHPGFLELYSQFGLALGRAPRERDPEIEALSCHVVALPEPEFYHLGTSRQLIESVSEMQNREARRTATGATRLYPDQIVQNSVVDLVVRRDVNRVIWFENSTVPESWRIASDHVITGAPANEWDLTLEQGVCLDFVPLGVANFCVRAYGIDDSFNGTLGGEDTQWFGRPVADWFSARGLTLAAASLAPDGDIFKAPLFPVLASAAIEPRFLEWLFASRPADDPAMARLWLDLPRRSAEALNIQANLRRIEAQRADYRARALQKMYKNRETSVFFRLDLDETARLFASGPLPLPPADDEDLDPMGRIHDHMWRAAVLRYRGQAGPEQEEAHAFSCLRETILGDVRALVPEPRCDVLTDQIVWGRAPARFDFAGGWTDTPPYCLQHGGRVTNIAVDLNGQPPIQVFAKLSERREIVIRSIDLGVEERVTSYDQLAAYYIPGSGFTLAKAALALAGFLPRFYGAGEFESLEKQLDDFGGGIELSLLAAIPQGSGLGTSSILAATLLGTLSELCGLHWDTQGITMRTMALEQMLTTGGGWQDQVGGILRGVKFCKTLPGLRQEITARWLPDYLFSDTYANRTMLLYYTGVTRLAKNILQEIVRGMFLNEAARLEVLKGIGENAEFVADAIQRIDWEGFCEGVRRSWDLNQRLDSGTNPPAIQAILDPIQDYLAGVKLLGAGGGGYMVMLAKDEQAALRIRKTLTTNPPNPKARFVDLSTSRIGLEITRS